MATILVVEDNNANATYTAFLLEKIGHKVLIANDAETGLQIAHANLPDLILMDVRLPEMNGLEATQLLKQDEATRNIPIIALTALKTDEHRGSMMTAGCDGYMTKPVHYRDFWNNVEKFLALETR